MSATIHKFGKTGVRRHMPETLFGPYTPKPGSVATFTKCGRAYDVEIIAPDGTVDVLATCGDQDDAEFHARRLAEAHGLEVKL